MCLQPHSPDNRALARECKDVKIDRVYIGSCTGGKTEDFLAAAKVFHASVSFSIFSCSCMTFDCNAISWISFLLLSLISHLMQIYMKI